MAMFNSTERKNGLDYAGDISPEEAFDFLLKHHAYLIDVRTLPEWQFVGVVDLGNTAGKAVTISWKHYPDFSLNLKFAEQLAALPDLSKETPIFFLCRSGGRSLDAAVAMTAAGYHTCYNIEGGFEGDHDGKGHRGITQGWKAKKLPWKQG
jgi:rhodanese-related sulfurtransferase